MSEVLDRARAAAERITATEDTGLNAVISFDRTTLLDQAERVDERRGGGDAACRGGGVAPAPPLTGLVLGIKDNICTLEYATTCASRILEGYRSPYEATAIRRLKEAGALIACKTNLDEFAMGSSTEHSAFGRTQHPDDPARVPGGSSGGSVALVAAGAVDAALGSETGGSVRRRRATTPRFAS